MLNLNTAEKMYQYCVNNNLGAGTTRGWAIKHFQLIIDNLNHGENIYCVFIGLHNYKSFTKHDGNFAYAITDKRIIMAQHKILGANVQSVSIENINDITLSKSIMTGIVCIDTYKETFNVGVDASSATNIYNCVHKALDKIKGNAFSPQTSNNVSYQKSPAEQIKEFKELLDMGIISQNEFDIKKKQLLGI